ncbi:hypothetical protein GO986_12095 [Deinococcus sp. HMF7620]|uniref:Uncharacterized protein n=1 Tax=Deinococcus arboris TaxID=2682977 RepID=A0A7C9IBN0_9DEIO|nr:MULTISPECIES: hypothetical protein [Deinococcus]MBZ9752142.1 hypothetical protein [Deinococcus betulae]MVN87506.1 hypothetical protein [Deinococcus arboris]
MFSLLLALPLLPAAPPPLHRLIAIGEAAAWPQAGAATLELQVHQAGVVTLTVDQPGFNGAAYAARRPGVIGDEQYRAGTPNTSYVLRDAQGTVLFTRMFAPGVLGQTTLFSGPLTPGRYTLSMTVASFAKRTSGVRISGPVAVQATSVNTTVQGSGWRPAGTFTLARPATLRLFNGDAPSELELRLRYQDGRVVALPSGTRAQWTQTAVAAGQGRVEARQGVKAKQWSKTFTLAFLDGLTPLPQVLQAWTPPASPMALPRPQIVEIRDQPVLVPQPPQTVEVQDTRRQAQAVTVQPVTQTPVATPEVSRVPQPGDPDFIGPLLPDVQARATPPQLTLLPALQPAAQGTRLQP